MADTQITGVPSRALTPPDLTPLFLSCAEDAAARGGDVERAVTRLANQVLASIAPAALSALGAVAREAVAA